MKDKDNTEIIQSEIETAVHNEFNNHIRYAHGILMYIFGGQIPELLLPFPKEVIIQVLNNFDKNIYETTVVSDASSTEFLCLDMYINNEFALKNIAKIASKMSYRNDFRKFFYIEQTKNYSQLIARRSV